MFSRRLFLVSLSALAAASVAQADGAKVYSGTYKDAAGHAGTLRCELTAKDGGAWSASLSGKNTGSGPNKPYQYSGTLTGKQDGANLSLTGEVEVQRQGPYVVTAVLANDVIKATFQKKAGGGDGSFEVTLEKGEGAPAPAAPAAPAPAPVAPKADEPKAK